MSEGLQIWDQNGVLTFDLADRFGLAIGMVSTGTTNGGVSDSRLAMGTPFYYLIPRSWTLGGLTNGSRDNVVPIITVTGSSILWSWPAISGTRVAHDLVYGVY